MPNGFTTVSSTFIINATTANSQSEPDVIYIAGESASEGVFGVAYVTDDPVDFNSNIFYREVNLDGSFASTEVVIFEGPGQQIGPKLVNLSGGEVVVAWLDVSRDSSNSEIRARIGSGDGTTTRADFDVASRSLSGAFDVSDRVADLIELAGGGFAVGSEFFANNGSNQAFVRLFAANGNPVNAPDRINDGSFRSAFEGLAELPDGRVQTLIETETDFPFVTVHEVRKFGLSGQPSGGATALSYADAFTLERSLTKLVDGRILETYTTQNFVGTESLLGVSARILAPSGAVLTGIGPLSEAPANDSILSRVAATPDGGFVAVWATAPRGQVFDNPSLVMRRFDYDGQPTGASVVVAAEHAVEHTVTVSPHGEVFVTWTTDVSAGNIEYDVAARTFTLDDLGTPGVSRVGTSGNDRLIGTADDDTLTGDDGADYLGGGAGRDQMFGGLGNDFYIVDNLGDAVLGEIAFSAGGGIDTVRAFVNYVQPDNVELVRLGNLAGTSPLTATGNDAPGTLVGNAGANILIGRGGNDQINGNGGNDRLIGNTGRDTLVGGAGADTFIYSSISESRVGIAERDLINGFDRGADRIDLSAMDANLGRAGEGAFDFIGTARFSGEAGELRLQGLGGANAVLVEADLRGDGVADFQIFVNLTTVLGAGDFIL